MNVNLTALIKSKAGHATELKSILLELVSHSVKETACLQYDLQQSTEDENQFIFHEIWQDQDGLDLHNSQPHIQRFIEQSADIINGNTLIYKTKKIS